MAEQSGRSLESERGALLTSLLSGGVEFVIIGGAAVQSHGVDYRTEDIDATPRRSRENLERLASVLNDLECVLVVDAADPTTDVPLPPDYFTSDNLAQTDLWNLRTRHGKLDIAFAPAGFAKGYEDLIGGATEITVAFTDTTASVAALVDVEHSKREAGRAKDIAYLESVGRLRTSKTQT
ncbi:MAG: hypothetical protein QM679_05135 [Patulibacter sp.]